MSTLHDRRQRRLPSPGTALRLAVLSTLLTIACAAGVELLLGWSGIPLPAVGAPVAPRLD